MTRPGISVIIPVYNGERYLAAAVNSVLEQTLPAREVIVVDDGSSDASLAVATTFGTQVQCISQPNSGAAAARNRGADAAKGEWLAFLDADDLWTPRKLESQIAAAEADPGLDMIFGLVRQFRQDGHAVDDNPALRGYFPSAMLVRREAFYWAGAFSSEWRIAEFIDWYARAVDAGLRSGIVNEVVTLRRIHETNQGVEKRHARGDFALVLKAALERRRHMRPGP
jgi:glycosyltransferase involved in cell wall biosynthesis